MKQKQTQWNSTVFNLRKKTANISEETRRMDLHVVKAVVEMNHSNFPFVKNRICENEHSIDWSKDYYSKQLMLNDDLHFKHQMNYAATC